MSIHRSLRIALFLAISLACASAAWGEQTTADKLEAAKTKVLALFSRACHGSKVEDEDVYAGYKSFLVSEFHPLLKQYKEELASSGILTSSQKEAQLKELETKLKILEEPTKLCGKPLYAENAPDKTLIVRAAADPEGHVGEPGKNAGGNGATGNPPRSAFVADAKHCAAATLSDCGESFQIIAGVGQSALSALNNNQGAFIHLFTRAPDTVWLRPWGRIRIVDVPQPSSNNVAAALTDPFGKIKPEVFAGIGAAVDYVFGIERDIKSFQHGRFSIGTIADFGAATPFSSQDVTLQFLVPAPNTAECAALAKKFQLARDPTGASCLQGGFKFLGLANQDRSNFLKKYEIGFRTTTRYCQESELGKGDCADQHAIQRGFVDFTIGQDQALSGGVMRHFVFKVDAIHPMPFMGTWLYLFGSAALRTSHNVNFDPLILAVPDSKNPFPSLPDPTALILPLRQADRDFYRIGIGLDLAKVFTKLATATTENQGGGKQNPGTSPENPK